MLKYILMAEFQNENLGVKFYACKWWVLTTDFSSPLFFSLQIYASMGGAHSIVYFCSIYLGILKRWDRSDAFELLTKETSSLERVNPLQVEIGNKGKRIETAHVDVHTTVSLLADFLEVQ